MNIKEVVNNFKNKKIAIIGDIMLDHYVWGKVSRVSPEAPVPVVDVMKENFQLGGAANVASNITTLGGKPFIFGVIGSDEKGKQLLKLLKSNGVNTDGIIDDKTRPTTVKTRVIAHQQHVVRIDSENKISISKNIENKLFENLKSNIKYFDGIILEDYNKGVLTEKLIEKIVKLAKKENKIVTVDPKFNNFFKFTNVTLFKPNRKELEEAFGSVLKSSEQIKKVVKNLQNKINAKYILLTEGEKGMSLFENGKLIHHLPAKSLKVLDVSGAGDTVIASVTMAMVSKVEIMDAMKIANHAAGIICQEVGAVPIKFSDLIKSF